MGSPEKHKEYGDLGATTKDHWVKRVNLSTCARAL